MLFNRTKTTMVAPESALPGRDRRSPCPTRHDVLGNALQPPFPEGLQTVIVGMGCFWGAERLFWQAPGRVDHRRRLRRRPHAEPDLRGGLQRPHRAHRGRAGRVRPAPIEHSRSILRAFWEGHDPTQGMRQGNDVGTQYRSAIYWTDDAQRAPIEASRDAYQRRAARPPAAARSRPSSARRRSSTTPRTTTSSTWPRIPNGYCGLGGTGVSCPVGHGVTPA